MRRGLICASFLALACIICSFSANALTCENGKWIYKGIRTKGATITFTSSESGKLTFMNNKKLLSYNFDLVNSQGASQTFFMVSGKHAPETVLMLYNDKFEESGWNDSTVMILPSLAVKFYYHFDDGPSRNGGLPDNTYRLVGCRDDAPHKPMKSGN